MNEIKDAKWKKHYLKNRAYYLKCFLDYKCKAYRTTIYIDYIIPMVLKRDNYKCVKCGSDQYPVVHHKHYDLNRLTYYDLETLCRKCHKGEHK